MNEKFVIEKQSIIESMCLSICKHGSLSKDLAQEVSIYFLTHKLPEVITDGFIYTVAYKYYHLSGSEFKRLHVDQVLKYAEELEEYSTIRDSLKDSVENEYNQALDELIPIEKVWAEELVKRNLSISLFSQHTGIGRKKATERMNSIYDKLRKANEK